jgi:NAD(P)-dependent dehydrogenase (short-subunit alcohol dehydrogenase family)
VIDAVERDLGPVDILVNNAGAIRGGSVLTAPVEAWVEDWQLKVVGYIRMVQAVLPSMQARRRGRIVNIAGTAARNPSAEYMAGGLANAGLVNWTRSLADLTAGDGILVNAVSPGPTATERWDGLLVQWAEDQGRTVEDVGADYLKAQPLGRLASPEDVADMVTFLVSERAGFVTGTCITVDGGASRGVWL